MAEGSVATSFPFLLRFFEVRSAAATLQPAVCFLLQAAAASCGSFTPVADLPCPPAFCR